VLIGHRRWLVQRLLIVRARVRVSGGVHSNEYPPVILVINSTTRLLIVLVRRCDDAQWTSGPAANSRSQSDVAANLTDGRRAGESELIWTHHIRIRVLEATIRATDPGGRRPVESARSSDISPHRQRRGRPRPTHRPINERATALPGDLGN